MNIYPRWPKQKYIDIARKLYWNNEIACLLWQSYEYIFLLTIVLSFTGVARHIRELMDPIHGMKFRTVIGFQNKKKNLYLFKWVS
jgi:hypothetical protein